MRERLATLISGSGTTMEAIISACQSGEVRMDIACVISSSKTAGGIEKAKRIGIPEKDIVIISPSQFRNEAGEINRKKFGERMLEILEEKGVTVITQNGWMPLTPANVIEKYSKRIFNQHPGPVPDTGGKGMYGRVPIASILYYRQMINRDYWIEPVIQRVALKFDEGVVVKSERVPIYKNDFVDKLQQRVLPVEHTIQIALLRDVTNGTVQEFELEPLAKSEEEQTILFQAIEKAKKDYPRG